MYGKGETSLRQFAFLADGGEMGALMRAQLVGDAARATLGLAAVAAVSYLRLPQRGGRERDLLGT